MSSYGLKFPVKANSRPFAAAYKYKLIPLKRIQNYLKQCNGIRNIGAHLPVDEKGGDNGRPAARELTKIKVRLAASCNVHKKTGKTRIG